MCGIAGFTVPMGLAPEQRRARFGERLRRMTASLWHRGPDAQRGLLLDGAALGHARLAIVQYPAGALNTELWKSVGDIAMASSASASRVLASTSSSL